MGPSSTLVIELSESDKPTDPLVKVFINDNLVKTNQCGNLDQCPMSIFMKALSTGAKYFKINDNTSDLCGKQ